MDTINESEEFKLKLAAFRFVHSVEWELLLNLANIYGQSALLKIAKTDLSDSTEDRSRLLLANKAITLNEFKNWILLQAEEYEADVKGKNEPPVNGKTHFTP